MTEIHLKEHQQTTKIAMVTGASKGIGTATAIRLARDGYNIVVNYFGDEVGGHDTASKIKECGKEALVCHADVRDVDQVKDMMKRTMERFGSLDVLVCNAGIYDRCGLTELDLDRWERTLDVNLNGAFICIKEAHELVNKYKNSSIVVVSSQIAFKGSKWGAHYAASKAGLIGMMKSMALELAPNIRINAIAPGYVNTDILGSDTPEKSEQRAKEVPMGRIGTPEDIANVVAFLVSQEAGYITGETIHVNGGLLMY